MKSIALDLPAPSDRELAQRLYEAERSLGGRLYELEKRLAVMDRKPVPPRPPEPRPPQATTQTAAGAANQRQRTLMRAIDETYFRVPIVPGVALYEGAVVTEVLNNDAWVMRFPNAATGTADVQVPTRELWVGARPRIDVWYTSPVGSTANFDFRLALWVHGPGLTTTYAPLLVSWTAPGPAVANTVLKTSAVITSSRFPTSPYGVTRLRLGRLAGDDNANDRDVLAAVVIFEETA